MVRSVVSCAEPDGASGWWLSCSSWGGHEGPAVVVVGVSAEGWSLVGRSVLFLRGADELAGGGFTDDVGAMTWFLLCPALAHAGGQVRWSEVQDRHCESGRAAQAQAACHPDGAGT